MALVQSGRSWQTIRQGLFSDTSLIIWVMVFQNLLRIVSSMALTRLLSADAFAVMAVITSVLVTIALVSDIGVSAFIVRHERTGEQEFRDEVWTLRLIRGLVLSILTAVIAYPVANAMGKPGLALVIAVAGLTSLFDSLQSLAPFTALRNRKIRKLTAIDVGVQVQGIVLSILLAAWLRSYWAIVFSNLFAQVLNIYFSYTMYDNAKQRWRFSAARSAELWKFSKFITGSTILTLIITQSDKLILARFLPLQTFGLYVIAASLAAAPVGLVSAYASRVMYPLFAQVRREAPDTLAHQFYGGRRLPTLFYAFAAGGLIGAGPIVIALLYDPRYLGAGVYLQIMAISSFFVMGNSAANEVMIALGRTSFTFYTNIVRLVYLLAAGAAGFYFLGPVGIIWAVGTVEVVAQLFAWIMLSRLGLLKLRWEMLTLAIGVAGVGAGYMLDLFGRMVIGIT